MGRDQPDTTIWKALSAVSFHWMASYPPNNPNIASTLTMGIGLLTAMATGHIFIPLTIQGVA